MEVGQYLSIRIMTGPMNATRMTDMTVTYAYLLYKSEELLSMVLLQVTLEAWK